MSCSKPRSTQYLGCVAAVARAGDGDALLLTSADIDAVLANFRFVAGRQHVQVRQQLACLDNLYPWTMSAGSLITSYPYNACTWRLIGRQCVQTSNCIIKQVPTQHKNLFVATRVHRSSEQNGVLDAQVLDPRTLRDEARARGTLDHPSNIDVRRLSVIGGLHLSEYRAHQRRLPAAHSPDHAHQFPGPYGELRHLEGEALTLACIRVPQMFLRVRYQM